MANKSLIMASSFTAESFESIDVDVSDSDSWQLIDSDDGNFSYGDVTTTDDDDNDGVVSDVDDLVQHRYASQSSNVSMQCQEVKNAYEIDRSCRTIDDDNSGGLIAGEDDPYEEGYEEEEDDLDLDDELVPKWLNNKFERQRMRKLGKKVYPKMKKSKRLVNQYNKPGCVHGKHGLGMKA
ncbi:hypothetical protein QVD17_19216 [Tagetes erecta]|uniref:Uncharacterized protein n=1 Tax=Tagetes erecta TaxID=13708 RepID=A0AAD8KM71_TARER|nr:hypothetical protein QVD17_19216 [Tagetes erecta]